MPSKVSSLCENMDVSLNILEALEYKLLDDPEYEMALGAMTTINKDRQGSQSILSLKGPSANVTSPGSRPLALHSRMSKNSSSSELRKMTADSRGTIDRLVVCSRGTAEVLSPLRTSKRELISLNSDSSGIAGALKVSKEINTANGSSDENLEGRNLVSRYKALCDAMGNMTGKLRGCQVGRQPPYLQSGDHYLPPSPGWPYPCHPHPSYPRHPPIQAWLNRFAYQLLTCCWWKLSLL